MTRIFRLRFRRVVIVGAAVPGVIALAVGTAVAAAATPTPPPSGPAASYSLPGQGHDQKFRPEAFDILISSLGDNNVDAYGPVHGLGGTDRRVAPFLEVWDFGQGNTVNVAHQAEPAPVLDLGTCTATIVLRDGWWKFAGGMGDFARAQGHGLFTELALFSFPITKDGRCVFDHQGQMVWSGGQSDNGQMPYMKDHGRNLRPLFFSYEIQGKGVAKVKQHEQQPPPPCVTPSPAPYGSADVCPSPSPTYPSPSATPTYAS